MRYIITLYKKYFKYVKPYLKYYIFLVPLSLLVSVITIPVPLLISEIVDLTLDKGYGETFKVVVLIFTIYIIQSISQYFINIFYSRWGNRCNHAIREDILNHIQKLPIEYIDKVGAGELLSRIMDDVSCLTELLTSSIITDLISNFLIMIITIVILIWINWKLTLVILVLIPVYCIIAKLFNSRIRKISRKIQDNSAQLISLLNEIFQNQKVIRAFNSELFFRDKYNLNQKKLIELYDKSNKFNFVVAQVTTFILNICPILVLLVGIIMVDKGSMTIGLLIAFYQYVIQAFSPFQLLMRYNLQIQSSHGAVSRINEFLELIVESNIKQNQKELLGNIEIKNLSFAYESTDYVLRNINLKINEGDFIGIVGTSGSGKSTLASLLLRFYSVEDNTIWIDGNDINYIDRSLLRNKIGIVTQEPYLFNDSILGNIKIANKDATYDQVINATKAAHIHDYITELPQGYETIIDEKGTNLSGGQKQRISLARIFLKNPSIVIFDEATSALDAKLESEINEAIHKLIQVSTCIMISHKINAVKAADNIFVFENGELIEYGDHKTLLKNQKLYYELYLKQN